MYFKQSSASAGLSNEPIVTYVCVTASPGLATNGLLRQYFPKSTNLAVHTRRDLERVESELNCRPRITLNDRSPAELFAALLASQSQPSLR